MAHAKRWKEEAELLVEEMQQIVLFWEWDAAHWDERGKTFRLDDCHILDGHCGYVQRQATLHHSFIQKCQSSWSDIIMLAKQLDQTKEAYNPATLSRMIEQAADNTNPDEDRGDC
ncbi:hypothetical protein L210DRAFT_3513073 [Boletus edulis BED1]|uniref:Uncharacterized protein n=1 Tax=Boletus edulis BED1 TaxID=1328754 RepID=A0AAD4G4T7_BOLED|nr:hypothetical protein L210DRAFT_3513073 [Boletus edulis BED1]